MNKCYAFSLFLSGTASALGTLAPIFMKLRFLISICLFISGCSIKEDAQQKTIYHSDAFSDSIPLTIYPGHGVDRIKLNVTTEKEVMNYKNLHFAVDSGESVTDFKSNACHTFWKRYNNESNGLQFTFTSECFMEPNSNPINYGLSLSGIKVKRNKFACTTNGICIGSSTYDDILKFYGSIKNTNVNKRYLQYSELGISYTFDKNYRLAAIELYKPLLKNRR